MEETLLYVLKSAGVLSIFVLIYHFLLRRLTFFKANRWFLLFGMIASVGFPWIEITQTVYVEQPPATYLPEQAMTPMAHVLKEPAAESFIDLNLMLLYLYAAISLFFLGKMAVELRSLSRLIRSGVRRREDGFVRISLSRKVTPFSFFNYICFYDKEENHPANNMILNHEQVHACEWHSVDLLLTHIYCAVFWVNPLAWLLKRQIGENLEFIADATAKVQNTTGISYERTLLSSAASHMQPALANNFFTPFIKKRIQMLQKETSKTWNAYKYALILPVIVLFLYSFNTVTKTEYVKSKMEANQSLEEPLIFDITSTTSQQELDRFVEMINDYADFKMDLKMETNDSGIEVFTVYSAFGDKKLFENFRMELADDILLLLEVSKDQARLNNTLTNETVTITSKGTTNTEISELLFTEDEKPNKTNRSEVSNFRITMPPTTTKEGLERIKKTLKTQYDVDFSYRNLTYKDGKIIKITIELDDNRGFKGSQNYSNSIAIPTICITGIIEENKKSWSMGNCDDNRMSFNGSNKTMNNILGSIQDLNLTEMKVKMSEMDMDSLQLTLKKLQTDLLLFQDDEINLQLKARLVEAEKRLSKMNVDSMMFGDPNVTYSLGNVTYSNNDSIEINSNDIWAYQNKNSVKRMYGNKPPLFILNGVEVKQEAFEKLSPKNIELVSVLKDESATSLYGDKGKNGVVIITTKVNPKTYSNALFVVNGKAVDKDIFSKMKPETIESVRILKDKNATSLWGEKGTNGVVVVTTKTDIKNAVMPLYIVNGKEMSEKEFKKLDVHRLKSISVLKDAKATSKYGDKSKNGVIEVELKTDAEMKKQPVNSNDLEEVIVTGYSTSTSTSIDFFTITIDDFKDSELAELKSTLKNLDHDFELKTFRKNGENVTKLKFDLDGTTYTYEPKNGMKSITIKMEDSSKTPKVSAVTY